MSRDSGTHNLGAGEWLMGAARNNPEGLLLVAAGCALMMRGRGSSFGRRDQSRRTNGRYGLRRSGPSRAAGSEGGGSLTQEASRAGESAREYAGELTEKVAETASSYASAVSTYAEETGRAVSETSGRYARQAQSTVQDAISRIVQEQPLALVLAGLAAGAAVAAALPATAVERRTLGPAGERLTDTAERAGERLKQSTAKAGERLMSAAEERGLDAEGLKELDTEVAGEFGRTVSDGEQSTKPTSSGFQSLGGARSQSTAGQGAQSGDQSRIGEKTATLDPLRKADAPGPGKRGGSGKRG